MDGEVRELIRRRGLDPFTDPGPVRVLVRDVVADYSERSVNSALPPIADAESVVRDVLDRVFIARRGLSELTTTILGHELADLVERMLRTPGRRIDMSTPFVDAMMPTDRGCTWSSPCPCGQQTHQHGRMAGSRRRSEPATAAT